MFRPDAPAERRSRVALLAALLLVLGIFVLETAQVLPATPVLLYPLVVLLGSSFLKRRDVILVAIVCVGLIVLASSLTDPHGTNANPATVRAASALALGLTAFLAVSYIAAQPNLSGIASFFDMCRDAVVVTDDGGTVLYWNHAAEELYGWAAQDVIGRDVSSFLQADVDGLQADSHARLSEAGRWSGEAVRRRRDGSRLTVMSRVSARRNAAGRITAILDTSYDITERKLTEDRLKATEHELRLMVDTIPALLWAASSEDGGVDYINARWRELGWTLDDIGGHNWGLMMHPDDLPTLKRDWSRAVATGEFYENPTRMRNASGEYRWTLIRAAPLRGPDGRILRWYGIANDIEERKQAEDALFRMQAELHRIARITTLGELAASIAHEVSQPLAAAVTNGEAALRWLSQEPPAVAAVHASIERVVANARRASDVIDRLRALAKRSEPQRQPVRLSDVIQSTLPLLQREIENTGAGLELRFDENGPVVPGDFVQLQQIVINLAINGLQAMKATERPHRQLTIHTRSIEDVDGPAAVLEVTDAGAGFDGADPSRLFDAFYTTKPDGLGMGLAICRSIVEAHQGQIHAEPGVDGGASFMIRFPMAARKEDA